MKTTATFSQDKDDNEFTVVIGTKPLRKILQYCKKDLSNITEDVVDDSIFDVEGNICVTVKDGHVMDIDINSVAGEDVVDDSFFDIEKTLA